MTTTPQPFRMRSLGRNATLAAAVALLTSQACSKTDPTGPGDAPNAGMPDMPAGNDSPEMPMTDLPSDDGTGPAEGGTSNVEGTEEGNPDPDMLTGPEDPSAGAGGEPMTGMEDVDDAPMFEQDDPNLVPPDSSYERVEIPVDVTNVMAIDIDDQDRVYVLERPGALKIWYPGEGRVVNAGTIPAFSGNEDGALSISLHPNFSENGWAYILYSSNQGPGQILSRFDIVEDLIDFSSESVMLRVPEEREERYHVAGGTDFDSQGNLYIASGDNTDPFASDGFSPHDERAGRRIWDAQRSAGNSRDLRGSILRIKPTDDGGYEIPEGNLFAADQGAPEIYIKGNRNPFRIAIDTATDWLYWGEVGPDSGNDAGGRGPRGYDEVNQAKGPGFFGWPYCIADNIPYVDFDFANSAGRGAFNCAAPVNDSPNNTGVRDLPPAQPAWIAYSYGTSPYPALGASGGRTATVADVYRWAPGGSPNKLPRHYDGSVILMEYIRDYIAEVRTDDEGNIQSVNRLFDSFAWNEIIQGRISPNGVLHVAQFGAQSTVYRMNYVGSDTAN